MFASAAVFCFAGFGAEGEAGVEGGTGVSFFFYRVELEVPGTPVGYIFLGHFSFKGEGLYGGGAVVCGVGVCVAGGVVGVKVFVGVKALETSCTD